MISIRLIWANVEVSKAYFCLFACLYFDLGSRRQYLSCSWNRYQLFLSFILLFGTGTIYSLSGTSLQMPHITGPVRDVQDPSLAHQTFHWKHWRLKPFWQWVLETLPIYSFLHPNRSQKVLWVLSYKQLRCKASLPDFTTNFIAFQ